MPLKIKTISVSAKASDMQFWKFVGEDDSRLLQFDGYAPNLQGLAGGDYVELKVDNATGKIIGWVPVDDDRLDLLIKEHQTDVN